MDVQKLAAAVVCYKILLKKKQKQKVKRRVCWVKPWIQRRLQLGAYATLTRELQIEDAQQIRNFVRMNAVQVQYIVDLVGYLAIFSIRYLLNTQKMIGTLKLNFLISLLRYSEHFVSHRMEFSS